MNQTVCRNFDDLSIVCRYWLSYKLTGDAAMFVLYVDVSNDGSLRHVNHELTVTVLCRVNLDFEGGQHISRMSFTHDVVHSVHCLRAGVCQKIHRHVECHRH